MKRLLFALCLLPALVFGANIDFRNLNPNHFTTNGFRVGLKSIPTNQTIAEYVTGTTNGLFILRVDGQGTNTSITNFNVNGAVKRPGTQLVHFAAVDLQITRTDTNQVASGYASLIGPGSLRSSARAIYSVVLNGFDNHVLVTGERSMIGGGQENTNGAPFSSIFGVGNYTSSNSAGNLFITGSHNRAEDLATDSGIIAGSDNQIAGLSTDVFILSSYISRIVDSSVAAIITAESGYITNGSYATIVGGIGNRNFNSTGGFQGGGTSSTLTNAPGSFTLGSSITIRAGNAGGLGFNLTNDIEGTVHMGNGELGNWFYADKTNAYLVGALKLVQTNAAATAMTTAGAVGIGTNAPSVPLEVFGATKLTGPTEGTVLWNPHVFGSLSGGYDNASELYLFGAHVISTTNASGFPGSFFAQENAGFYAESKLLALTNRMVPGGFGSMHPNNAVHILQGPDPATDAIWSFNADQSLGPTKATQNLASAITPINNGFFKTITGVGSEPGLMLLRNSNLVGAVGFTHSGPSSASNIFNFAGITNPVAGQILKIHSVSGNVVTLTNDTDSGGSGGASTNLDNLTVTNVARFNGPVIPEIVTAVYVGTNLVIDASLGDEFLGLLTNAHTGLLVTNALHGQKIGVRLIQDATGNRLVNLVNQTVGSSTNYWNPGTDITGFTATTNAHKMDRLRAEFIGGIAGVANSTNRLDEIGALRGY